LKQRLLPKNEVLSGSQELDRPVAAVAIIINPKLEGGSLLLIKRAERESDPWSGQIAFPGGHKSSEDGTFLETVCREAYEEVGIRLGEQELLGVLPIVRAHTRQILVAPFVFQLATDVDVRTNEEVAESFWSPLSELKNLNTTTSQVQAEGRALNVDSYIFRDHVIWGLSYRIINILFDKA
jgi:8-oxo-dGTP pyrophosphatase MutT (NUDIX family)